MQIAEDDGIMAMGLRENLLGALNAVHDSLGFDRDFGEEFEDDL